MANPKTRRSEPRDEDLAMPHPPPVTGPRRRLLRSRPEREWITEEERRAERECTILGEELEALDQDIASARGALGRATATPDLVVHAGRKPPTSRPHGERVQLPDGAEILIRPIEPEDATQLKQGFQRLAALSRYHRFLTPVHHLTAAQLAYLTRVDHVAHEALVAQDAATEDGVGVARYVRDPDDHTQAQVAVVVAENWHGRGVGTALLERLAARAQATGLRRFTARMLVSNRAARRLLARVGDIISESADAGTVEVTVRLRSDSAGHVP